MTRVMKGLCWHKNFDPKGLPAPASDKAFLLTSNFCPQGVACLCPGAIYMFKMIKNVYKIDFKEIVSSYPGAIYIYLRINCWFFFCFLEVWMKKPTCTLYDRCSPQWKSRHAHCMTGIARHMKMCMSVFSFIPQGNEKKINCQFW